MSDPVTNYDHKTIQFRRGTTEEWRKFGSRCIPAEAEICVEFFQTASGARNGSVGIKVGNGVSTYNQLSHIVSDEESDPVFTSHPAYQITQELIDSWSDDAGKTEFPPESHTHEQSEVGGLEVRLDAIEDSIISGGGFIDAPNDGKLYGRQSEGWAEVVIPEAEASDWADIENKPTEFPPSAHTHEIAEVNGLQDALDNAGGDTTGLEADVAANTSAISGNTSAISSNTNAIATKLDADKIWTGTEAQYDNLSPDADTLYFITENVRAGSADIFLPDMGQMPSVLRS
jgi:hypothetical protein